MDYVPKNNTKRDMRCLELPYVTAEGGSRLRATLRFAQRRSQKPLKCYDSYKLIIYIFGVAVKDHSE